MKKSKLFTAGAVLFSAVFGLMSHQAMADERHPDMPSGGKCIPGDSSCKANQNDNGSVNMPLTADSVTTFKGTVKSMNRVQYPDGTKIHMILETSKGDMKVVLGPAHVMDRSKMGIMSGDKVQVTGYEVTANGKTMIVATAVKKSGNSIQLRDENGHPMYPERPLNGRQR